MIGSGVAADAQARRDRVPGRVVENRKIPSNRCVRGRRGRRTMCACPRSARRRHTRRPLWAACDGVPGDTERVRRVRRGQSVRSAVLPVVRSLPVEFRRAGRGARGRPARGEPGRAGRPADREPTANPTVPADPPTTYTDPPTAYTTVSADPPTAILQGRVPARRTPEDRVRPDPVPPDRVPRTGARGPGKGGGAAEGHRAPARGGGGRRRRRAPGRPQRRRRAAGQEPLVDRRGVPRRVRAAAALAVGDRAGDQAAARGPHVGADRVRRAAGHAGRRPAPAPAGAGAPGERRAGAHGRRDRAGGAADRRSRADPDGAGRGPREGRAARAVHRASGQPRCQPPPPRHVLRLGRRGGRALRVRPRGGRGPTRRWCRRPGAGHGAAARRRGTLRALPHRAGDRRRDGTPRRRTADPGDVGRAGRGPGAAPVGAERAAHRRQPRRRAAGRGGQPRGQPGTARAPRRARPGEADRVRVPVRRAVGAARRRTRHARAAACPGAAAR